MIQVMTSTVGRSWTKKVCTYWQMAKQEAILDDVADGPTEQERVIEQLKALNEKRNSEYSVNIFPIMKPSN